MRIKPAYFIVAFLAAGSMPANAAGTSNTTQSQQAPAKSDARSVSADSAKKICRQVETTGTRFTERVCLTKAQWKEVESN